MMTTTETIIDQNDRTRDPVLAMLGVGEQAWRRESGDELIERLRSEAEPPFTHEHSAAPQDRVAEVWRRIAAHQGQTFHTTRGLALTYEIEGTGIWFFRDSKRVNRKLTRKQTEEAILRCPLRSTTEIKDLIDYPYLFAILTDERIKFGIW